MMSDDDAAYSALLVQLFSESAPTRNTRVHSWIEHQYDFVLSEQPSLSRPPSPSPSSSLGAHRAFSVDRPDSRRVSSDRPSSTCTSYDDIFFPVAGDDFEEQERVRALRFIVQEMAHYQPQDPCPPNYNKPLPAPPPSPASSLTSRLHSFTNTLSTDQSRHKEISTPLPVSVIVHGEYQHDARRDAYLHKHGDSFIHSLAHSKGHAAQYPIPIADDKDSFQLSPTLSHFSCAYSGETTPTSLYPSFPASPTDPVFSPCAPENIALPASPFDQAMPFFLTAHDRSHSMRNSQSLSSLAASPPKTNVVPPFPISPVLSTSPQDVPHHLRAPTHAIRSQSRWSITTTASLTPLAVELKAKEDADPKTHPGGKKGLKSPRKRSRFTNLISRFSPGCNDPLLKQSSDNVDRDLASDAEDKEKRSKKPMGKKSSLISIRASLSLSKAPFSSQRPPISPSFENVPPLPSLPTVVAPTAECIPSEAPSKLSLSRVSSRGDMLDSSLPPVPRSASKIMTFLRGSQFSPSDVSQSAFDSCIPSASAMTDLNGSQISLPPPSKQTFLASAAGIEPVVSTKSVPITQVTRSNCTLGLTAKPKSIKMPVSLGAEETTGLPVSGNTSLSSVTTVCSRIPQAPTKFNPPAKLATVIATQSRQIPPPLVSPGLPLPTSKLPTLPSRVPAKDQRPSTTLDKQLTQSPPSAPPSSILPTPTSIKVTHGTVEGFWKRQ